MAPAASDAKSDSILLCPVCNEHLYHRERMFVCNLGHQYDIAKEGYVNLLRLKKRPKFLGDSKEMFQARRTFLDAGHYAPLAEKIAHAIQRHCGQVHQRSSPGPYHILDAGCGEGYYMRRVAEWLDAPPSDSTAKGSASSYRFFGMDIAKDGPRLAAKRMPSCCFFVADVKQPLLFPDNAVDAILNIFAPRNAAEFARILNPAGQLIVVIPNINHLEEVRSHVKLLAIQADKEKQIVAPMAAAGLTLADSQSLSFAMQLSPDGLRSLIHMTPSHRHFTGKDKAGKDKAGATKAGATTKAGVVEKTLSTLDNPFHVTASFQVLTFQHA